MSHFREIYSLSCREKNTLQNGKKIVSIGKELTEISAILEKLKCPSVRSFVRPSVRPFVLALVVTFSNPIELKFGMYVP